MTHDSNLTPYLLLLGVGAGAGLINSVAGGGSFLTFPALVFLGVPSVIANATSTVALFPGVFASAWAYRNDFQRLEKIPLKPAVIVSIGGGIAGALLLLFTAQRTFDAIIPWILLMATVALKSIQGIIASNVLCAVKRSNSAPAIPPPILTITAGLRGIFSSR